MRHLILPTLAATLLFLALPNLDLAVSRLFYVEGHGFPWRENPAVVACYYLIRVMSFGAALTLLGMVFCHSVKQKLPLAARFTRIFSARQVTYLLAALILGPGFLVHNVVKEAVGRPRPVNIQEFGGAKPYAPPFATPHDPEGKSFVSGHTAAGTYFTAFGLVARGKRRKQLYAGGLALGAFTTFIRIIQGGHFLSDCVFAMLLTLWVNHALYRAMFGRKESKESGD